MWDLAIHPTWWLDVSTECFIPLYNRGEISQSIPFRGSASLLAHHLMSGPNTICNSPGSPLVDIVCFGPLRITISLTFLQDVYWERGFHTLTRNASFSSLTDVESHTHSLPSSNLCLLNKMKNLKPKTENTANSATSVSL